jgi:nitric oxide reductase NorQ protein
MACFNQLVPLMIKGPTGCGKSRFIQKMSQELKVPLIQVACNEETSSTDLQGRFLLEQNNTIWKDGPMTKSVKEGCILYLDEICEAREDIIVAIHPLSDYRRELYLDKQNKTIKAHKNFMLVASYNPNYQSVSKTLKLSTKQRFITINFSYPDPIIEKEIIIKETLIEEKYANILVAYATKLRNLKDIELLEDISTRILINTAKLIKLKIKLDIAINVGIINTLTDDTETIVALNDIFNLIR